MKSTTLNLTWEQQRVMNLVPRWDAQSAVRDSLWVSRMSRAGANSTPAPVTARGHALQSPRDISSTLEPGQRSGARSGEDLAYGTLAVSSLGVLTLAFSQALSTIV